LFVVLLPTLVNKDVYKRRYKLRFFSTFGENNWVNFGRLTNKWPWPRNSIWF